MEGEQATPVSFFDSLPDDIKTSEAYAPYKEMQPADIVKGHAELSGKLKDALVPLGENATDEERTAFDGKVRQLLGVPEKAEDYKLELPEVVPRDDPLLVAYANKLHEAGASPAHVQAGINAFVEFAKQAEESARVEIGKQQEALKIEWGSQYDERIKAAETTMRLIGEEAGFKNEEIQQAISRTGMKNDIVIVKMFDKLSRFYKEGQLKGEGPGSKSLEEKFFPGGIK